MPAKRTKVEQGKALLDQLRSLFADSWQQHLDALSDADRELAETALAAEREALHDNPVVQQFDSEAKTLLEAVDALGTYRERFDREVALAGIDASDALTVAEHAARLVERLSASNKSGNVRRESAGGKADMDWAAIAGKKPLLIAVDGYGKQGEVQKAAPVWLVVPPTKPDALGEFLWLTGGLKSSVNVSTAFSTPGRVRRKGCGSSTGASAAVVRAIKHAYGLDADVSGLDGFMTGYTVVTDRKVPADVRKLTHDDLEVLFRRVPRPMSVTF